MLQTNLRSHISTTNLHYNLKKSTTLDNTGSHVQSVSLHVQTNTLILEAYCPLN